MQDVRGFARGSGQDKGPERPQQGQDPVSAVKRRRQGGAPSLPSFRPGQAPQCKSSRNPAPLQQLDLPHGSSLVGNSGTLRTLSRFQEGEKGSEIQGAPGISPNQGWEV